MLHLWVHFSELPVCKIGMEWKLSHLSVHLFPGPVYNNMAGNYQYILFQVPDAMNRARLEGAASSRFLYT